jgi:dTDP-4-dehydrorhamnose reductase
MKVVILGSTGMLGNMLKDYFIHEADDSIDDVLLSVRSENRLKHVDEFVYDPLRFGVDELPEADVFINAIGIIKPAMTKNIMDSIFINSIFPRMLSVECKSRKAKLIHITTDCVFSGKDGNYNENSPHDALDDYGKSKSLGEPTDCMVIRTSIIGPETNNFYSLVEWVKQQKGKEINGFTNHMWNGITTLQYAKICNQILNNDLYEEGLFHVHSPTEVSKFELVSMISDHYNIGAKITPTEAPIVIDRTLSTVKSMCEKLNIPEIKQQINEL